jgi:hypothetical protein
MRKLAATFSIAASALSLVSCWAPYYDPEVSGSVALADELGDPVLSIGPISGQGMFDSSSSGFEFLPSRPSGDPASPSDGFLVQKGDGRIGVAFVAKKGGEYGIASSSQGTSNYFGSDIFLRSEASTAAGYPQMIAAADHQSLRRFQYNPATGALSQDWSSNAASVKVYGTGAVLADAASDAELCSVLFSNGTQVRVWKGALGAAFGPFTDPYAAAINAGGRSLDIGGRAFFAPGGAYFFFSDPDGLVLRWDMAALPGGAPVKLAVSSPLVAVLSDGTLAAQDDLHLGAYTASGKKLFTKLAGSIRLCHEVYAPGPSPEAGFYLIFSQVLSTGGSNSDKRQFYIKVWRCSLADFKKLD